MINIAKGRFWDLPWSLVDGCTPCSPGCDHCWAAAIEHHYRSFKGGWNPDRLTDIDGKFKGEIRLHPERLSIPLKRRKPTVYAVWNDFFHGVIDHSFRCGAYNTMMRTDYRHTYLILTKRADFAAQYAQSFNNIWHGLTVCNQPELEAKIGDFFQVPGKKFLSLEPLLGPVDLTDFGPNRESGVHGWSCLWDTPLRSRIDAVILGGETGPGARPMHPNWVRSVRDQCAAAGVPFFFKGWGAWVQSEYKTYSLFNKKMAGDFMTTTCVSSSDRKSVGEINHYPIPADYDGYPAGIAKMERKKNAGRLLDGRTHDDLPWRTAP